MTTITSLTITTPAGVEVIKNTTLVVNIIHEDIEGEEVTIVTEEGGDTTEEDGVVIGIMSLEVNTKRKGSQII